MAYCYPNYQTKKALKEAVAQGTTVIVMENTPSGQEQVINGDTSLEGPHYPEPHRWYAGVTVKNSTIVEVR